MLGVGRGPMPSFVPVRTFMRSGQRLMARMVKGCDYAPCVTMLNVGEIAPMDDCKMREASQFLRKKLFEASEKERKVVLISNMISDFDKMIVDLDRQIAAEEDRTRIKDTGHPAYSTFATAAAKRRQNLLNSVAHTQLMLDVARRELHEVTVQLRDLGPTQNNEPCPASSTLGAISVLR